MRKVLSMLLLTAVVVLVAPAASAQASPRWMTPFPAWRCTVVQTVGVALGSTVYQRLRICGGRTYVISTRYVQNEATP